MKALARLATPVLAACAMVGLAATSASAATTTVHEDSATGAPYSGAYQITNLGNITFSGTVLGISATTSCTSVTLQGTLNSDGTNGTLTGASVTGCTGSGVVTSADISFQNLPYDTAGANGVTYDPVDGGRDGVLTFGDPKLQIKAVLGTFLGTQTCYYHTDATHPSLQFQVYNRDNANRPNSADDLQGQMVNASLALASGSSGLCPSDVQANGTGYARGQSADGTFGQKLYLTG